MTTPAVENAQEQQSENRGTVQPAQVKQAQPPSIIKSKIPPLAPYVAPNVICPNRDCGKILTPKIFADKGGEKKIRYDCQPCHYSFYGSLIHMNGNYVSLGAEEKVLPGMGTGR